MEAMVENTATPPTRFYCHTCTIEIDSISSEFTCPLCSQGFIEELPAQDRSGSSSAPPPLLDLGQGSNDYVNPQFSNEQAIRLAGEIFTNHFLSPFFRNPNDPRDGEVAGASSGSGNDDHAMYTLEDIPVDANVDPGLSTIGGTGPVRHDGGEGAASSSGSAAGAGGVTLFGGDPRPAMRFPGRRGSRRRGMQHINHVDHILREILISVSGGANGGGAGAPMFFMGNPGDYAWGREGIDTIVTQLLNQMDNTGPPPLEKERIAEIPIVTINAEQVDRKLQCSVCFEDFVIDEAVRKLPCMHVYHEPCIIPWLELHGTCPICRKSLTPEQSQANPQQQTQGSSGTSADGHSEQQSQEQRQAQQNSSAQLHEGERQNVFTFRIRPSVTTMLSDMGQPTAASVSSSSLPQAGGSAPGSAVPPGSGVAPVGHGSSALRPTNAPPPGPSSSHGSRTADQSSTSNRDDDGNIDYTLDLD